MSEKEGSFNEDEDLKNYYDDEDLQEDDHSEEEEFEGNYHKPNLPSQNKFQPDQSDTKQKVQFYNDQPYDLAYEIEESVESLRDQPQTEIKPSINHTTGSNQKKPQEKASNPSNLSSHQSQENSEEYENEEYEHKYDKKQLQNEQTEHKENIPNFNKPTALPKYDFNEIFSSSISELQDLVEIMQK